MHEKKTMARKRDEEGVSDIDRGFDVAVLVCVVISPVGGQEEVAVALFVWRQYLQVVQSVNVTKIIFSPRGALVIKLFQNLVCRNILIHM